MTSMLTFTVAAIAFAASTHAATFERNFGVFRELMEIEVEADMEDCGAPEVCICHLDKGWHASRGSTCLPRYESKRCFEFVL
jgi:hypothetical protein